jgi:hypothetical protein
MGEIFRYAWRGFYENWKNPTFALVGGFVGGLVLDEIGVEFIQPFKRVVENPLLGNAIAGGVGAVIGAALIFFGRLFWAPFHFAFTPRGGVVAELKERFGANMGPLLLMVAGIVAWAVVFGIGVLWSVWLAAAGIVLFVLLFGGGALWFIWPKSPATSSRPYPTTHAEKLAALHWRQAAVEFGQFAKRYSDTSDATLKIFLSGNRDATYNGVIRQGTNGMQLAGLAARMAEIVQRDFGQPLFAPRDLDRDRNLPAMDEDKVEPTYKGIYRVFRHARDAGSGAVSTFNDRYKLIVANLDRVPVVTFGPLGGEARHLPLPPPI